ncbi:hypothetical protein [Arsenophonus nasoniae]|uniref:hypothetical protein n=1 Tax=Arsenophonus nasoniae TaxID=638 RepID=UPI0014386BD7|nr:hypothetical protein [Arsenophonus nasoniae]
MARNKSPRKRKPVKSGPGCPSLPCWRLFIRNVLSLSPTRKCDDRPPGFFYDT